MDAEQSPSEKDSDSVATELEEVNPLPEGAHIVGEIHLDRNLDPEVSWICLGLDRKTGTVHTFIPKGDWPNEFEMRGFIDSVFNPEFVLASMRQSGGGDNGKQS